MTALERVRALLPQLDVDALVVHEPATKIYLDALSGSGVWLVITATEAYQIMDGRYEVAARDYADRFINQVTPQGSVFTGVLDWIATHHPKRIGIESELPYAMYHELERGCPVVPLHDAIPLIRARKTPAEVARVRAACRLADDIFPALLKQIHVGMTENDVVGELFRLVYRFGASGVSFDPVICSGPRTAMPHGRASGRQIEAGDFLLLDYGVVKDGYQSDMTRTVAVGHATAQFTKLYETLLPIQQTMVSRYESGRIGGQLHQEAANLIATAGYGAYFNHGLGHGLGIGGGERPLINATSLDVLQPGMIATCEPGIYVPGVGGIRIEDDVLVTEAGPESLSQTPRELLVVG